MLSSFRLILLIQILIFISNLLSQNIQPKVLESTENHIIFEIDFSNSFFLVDTIIDGNSYQIIKGNDNYWREAGEPWLPLSNFSVGIPFNSNPEIKILDQAKVIYSNKFIIPFPENDPQFETPDVNKINQAIYSSNKLFPDKSVELGSPYIFRFSKILPIKISPFQFNPVTRELVFYSKLRLRVDFTKSGATDRVEINDAMTQDFIRNSVINAKVAVRWITKPILESDSPQSGDGHWYNPNKNYYKIYLKEKGVYRLTYNQLISAGVPLGSNTSKNKLEIFNDGNPVPIDIVDVNNDQLFNNNDYLQFVGFPPPASLYSALNIYNLSNVYWFSYESDSTGLLYDLKDAHPYNWNSTITTVSNTVHYEVDTLYERFGHANDDHRDYWQWGTTTGTNGTLTKLFTGVFPYPKNLNPESNSIDVTVKLHGLTTASCSPDHKVRLSLTSQFIGEHTWDGQTETTYTATVDLNEVNLYAFNNLQIAANGDICGSNPDKTDQVYINWFEIRYPMNLRANGNNISFKSPEYTSGLIRFQVFNWLKDNIKIYTPETGEQLINAFISYDQYNSVFFAEQLNSQREYFCVADDYYFQVDSIVHDQSSDLHNLTNGADYIIIYHPKFLENVNQLVNYRNINFPDESISNPRILAIDIQQVYDEFSAGLLDPYSLQRFVQYTFDYWQSPAPLYIVLFGDMSYDYRSLIEGSRPNFIPSLPFHTTTYGQAASDNLIVCVSGNDLAPDLAIGRLSAETTEEAEILVSKIMNYPDDYSKLWKQNVLLISSGLNLNDETTFHFNDANLRLDNDYLVPIGITSNKIFRYPSKPEHIPFQGEGPEIRAGFNSGAVLTSYYGHGGGYQWDLVFAGDDIDQLENGGRLPVISSVTCYTAHFDNQDVFGEHFNKVPGKGSIGFYGSSGLTYWNTGRSLNEQLFKDIFIHKNYVIGKAILNSKNVFNPIGATGIQNMLLTYLGDPVLKLTLPDKPDFVIKDSDIFIANDPVLVNEETEVKVRLRNYGIYFPEDSVIVQLAASSSDTSYVIAENKFGSFGEIDSMLVSWLPTKKGLYELTVRINEIEAIPEMDHSDNETSISVVVFDLGEPSIVEPINGFVTSENTVNFTFIDNGIYLDFDLRYLIQMDTSISFESPFFESSEIVPEEGLLNWESPQLNEGIYFWRTKIINNGDSSVWSDPRVLNIRYNSDKYGYFIEKEGLKSLHVNNVNYSDSLESLILNTEPLPPRPANNTFLEDLNFELPPDLSGVTSITTDGTYIYIAQISYWIGGNPSKIYKIGTGYNGTIKGFNYGSIPGVNVHIWDQMFYYPDNEGGHIYVANGNPYNLTKVNPESGEISSVTIPDGMLNVLDGLVHPGAFYITSNGRYAYNIAIRNESGENKYTVRTFDPLNEWQKVGNDLVPAGGSYEAFTNFFVADHYLFAYERFDQRYLRRINLDNGAYEEQWYSFIPAQRFYAWTYDWENDRVYSSIYQAINMPTKITVFKGTYRDANGSIVTDQVGPAARWDSLYYYMDYEGSSGNFITELRGFNKTTKIWETLNNDPPAQMSLELIDANHYPFLELHFELNDTSFGANEPIKVNGVNISYATPSEVMITKQNISFNPDTILQGFNTEVTTQIRNIGDWDADSIRLDYFYEEVIDSTEDSSFVTRFVSIPASGSVQFIDTVNTSDVIFESTFKVKADYPGNEFFKFNNFSENIHFVARDSLKPIFSVTFDGDEILNEDIVSSNPDIMITLEDNSPLPIDTSYFTLIYDNEPLYFTRLDLSYEYTPYPNSRSEIHWTPELDDGRHVLEILAKDASGNFFDSTSSRTVFNVFNEADIVDVYNYPNPFSKETHFTFQLRGSEPPEEFNIKIYTVAGRLIRDIDVPVSELKIGFNKYFWNGKDQDGDEIGNGVYIYRVKAKFGDKTKSITQKLARVR